MRNIFKFLTKNSFIFLFLLLEFFAFWMLIANNNYQNSSFFNSSNFFVGNMFSTIQNINDYFNLKQVNKELAEQNAKLQSNNIASFTKVYGRIFEINDTVYHQNYRYSAAKVVNNSTNKRQNYITIDKGELNGIEAEMGVICANGVVGIVKNVSKNFGSVMSVLHDKYKLSAKIKKSGYFGSLVWEGNNYREAQLKDIPNHVKLVIGDTVVTTGYSTIFPENILIGWVKEFDLPEGNNFYNITIEFAVDYKNLSHVYVVRSLMKEEQLKLEAESQQEATE
ncbi:MAG: rod shape-determining protein MreC [Flavobacteriales bacterium]|nr:rod shape-determining protein MreC [Flavobacteriales bacterium]MCL4856199.1 rod shape-determining protein MreC [Flavobacteriales bacterium]